MEKRSALIAVACVLARAQVCAQPAFAIIVLAVIAWHNLHTAATRKPAIRFADVAGAIRPIPFIARVDTLTPCVSSASCQRVRNCQAIRAAGGITAASREGAICPAYV